MHISTALAAYHGYSGARHLHDVRRDPGGHGAAELPAHAPAKAALAERLVEGEVLKSRNGNAAEVLQRLLHSARTMDATPAQLSRGTSIGTTRAIGAYLENAAIDTAGSGEPLHLIDDYA